MKFFLAVCLCVLPLTASAATCTLGWKHDDPATIDGYRMYEAITPPNYVLKDTITPSSTLTWIGCVPGKWYRVTAFKAGEVESAPSNEVQPRQTPAPHDITVILEIRVPLQ